MKTTNMMGIAALTAFAWSSTATAQPTPVPDTPYVQEIFDDVQVDLLDNPTVVSQPSSGGVFSGVSEVPIPFQFKYYDDNVQTVTMNVNGAVAMRDGVGTAFNANSWAPGSSPQFGTDINGWIAPWWGDSFPNSQTSSLVGYQLEGQAPQRTMTLQWGNMTDSSSQFGCCDFDITTQVVLYEGLSGRIDIKFSGVVSNLGGVSTFNDYTVGMESRQGDRPIEFLTPACSPDCRPDTLLTQLGDKQITLRQDPGIELVAVSMALPEFAPLGAVTPVPVTVANLNGSLLGPFVITLEASTSRNFDPDLAPVIEVGSEEFRLFPYSTRNLEVPMEPELTLGEQRYFVRAIVDSGDAVPEVEENNNIVASPTPVRYLPSRPDLAVQEVRIPKSEAEPGEFLDILVRIANIGSEDVSLAEGSLSMVLSGNPAISPQDAEIGRTAVELAAGEAEDVTVTIQIPDPVNSGSYFIGAFLDLENTLVESNESNNGRAAFVPLSISGGQLAIVTSRLPAAILQERYTAILAAVGGDGNYTWGLTQGSEPLPSNLSIEAGSGAVFGVCNEAGTSNIEVSVSSQGETATRQYSFSCSDPSEPLTVVTRSVPDAILGQEYVFQLLATGGESASAPLTWSATDLPMGLRIEADNIVGTPVMPGESSTTISVDDGTSTDDQVVSFTVRPNQNLLIDVIALPMGELGAAYEAQLSASGGVGDIIFEIDGTGLPRGLVLDPDGRLRGIPDEVGTFNFTVVAKDTPPPGSELRAEDRNSFELSIIDGAESFFVATQQLPPGAVGSGYSQAISSVGGVEPISWQVDGVLPEGLETAVSNNELQIIGTPLVTDARNLLVTATDNVGRVASRVLVLEVGGEGSNSPQCPDPAFPQICNDELENADSGCSATGFNGGALSGLLLAFGGMLLLRRRRDA
ncbi:MAG: putative Ig domain-containing protein [Myxococcota bacterium]